jgi:hypothetical protein
LNWRFVATAVYSIGCDSLGRISSFTAQLAPCAASNSPLPAQGAVFTYGANGNRLPAESRLCFRAI